MAINIVDVGGVNLLSHPILQRDCAFPITNLGTHCPPDQVFQNTAIVYGGWDDGVTAPAITGTGYTIHATNPCPPSEPCLDACRSPIVNMNLNTCELLAPSMKCVSLGTPIMDWRTVISRYCRQRNILAAGLNIFDRNGILDYSQRTTLDFVKFALQAVWETMGQLIVYNATKGDSSLQNQWDGLYTQLRNGWEPATNNPCPDEFNKEQSVDWAALTGKAGPGGTPVMASPDDCTVTGKFVTIWGKVYAVPAGLNLAEFIDDLWMPKIEAEGVCKGEINAFELHVGWGQAKCFINTVACMKACSACEEDPQQRDRLMNFNKKMMVELFPSGTRLPILQARYMEANTIRLGPRLINGEPTYALFIEDMDKWLSMLPTQPFDKIKFRGDPEYSFLCDTDWGKQIESRGMYWNLRPVEDKCIKGVSQLCGGVLATARHLWLRIDNVTCGSFVDTCELPVTYN